MDGTPIDPGAADAATATQPLDELRRELEDGKKQELELKAANTELEQIIKDLDPILKDYEAKRVGFLNDRRRLGCYHEEATRRIEDELPEADVADVRTVVSRVEEQIEVARSVRDAKATALAGEQADLATATDDAAQAKQAFQELKGRSKWLAETLKALDALAQGADAFEKARKLKAAYAVLLLLDAGLDDLEDGDIPDVPEFGENLLALERAFTTATRTLRERQAAVDTATLELANAQKALDQLVAGRQKAVLEQLEPKSA